MDWTRSEIMSALALAISSLGFVVSYLSYHRTAKFTEPHAWIDLESIGALGCWRASVHLSNPTKYVLKITKVVTSINRIPVDDRQNFILGDYHLALAEAGGEVQKLASFVSGKDNSFALSPPRETAIVHPGSTGIFQFLVFRGRLSTARKIQVTVHIEALQAKAKQKSITVYGKVPSPGLEIHVQRA